MIEHGAWCHRRFYQVDLQQVIYAYRVAPDNWHNIFVPLNFIRYAAIYETISMPESEENF